MAKMSPGLPFKHPYSSPKIYKSPAWHVFRYHERKRSITTIITPGPLGYLDWETQPNAFRVYEGGDPGSTAAALKNNPEGQHLDLRAAHMQLVLGF